VPDATAFSLDPCRQLCSLKGSGDFGTHHSLFDVTLSVFTSLRTVCLLNERRGVAREFLTGWIKSHRVASTDSEGWNNVHLAPELYEGVLSVCFAEG